MALTNFSAGQSGGGDLGFRPPPLAGCRGGGEERSVSVAVLSDGMGIQWQNGRDPWRRRIEHLTEKTGRYPISKRYLSRAISVHPRTCLPNRGA
jgi:hypothetical protein